MSQQCCQKNPVRFEGTVPEVVPVVLEKNPVTGLPMVPGHGAKRTSFLSWDQAQTRVKTNSAWAKNRETLVRSLISTEEAETEAKNNLLDTAGQCSPQVVEEFLRRNPILSTFDQDLSEELFPGIVGACPFS